MGWARSSPFALLPDIQTELKVEMPCIDPFDISNGNPPKVYRFGAFSIGMRSVAAHYLRRPAAIMAAQFSDGFYGNSLCRRRSWTRAYAQSATPSNMPDGVL